MLVEKKFIQAEERFAKEHRKSMDSGRLPLVVEWQGLGAFGPRGWGSVGPGRSCPAAMP